MRKDISGRIRAAHTHGIMNMAFRALIASLLGALAMVCAGCGGGGGGSPAPTIAAPAPAPAKKIVTIEYVGDSTVVGCTFTQGAAPNTGGCVAIDHAPVATPEPAGVQALLDAAIPTESFKVVNSGVAGTTAEQLLNGTNGFSGTWAAHVAASTSQTFVVQFGINDSYVVGMTPALFASQIDQIISVVKAAGKQIIIETPNPTATDHSSFMGTMVASEKATAANWGVTVIDQYGQLSNSPTWPQMLGSDGVHPTQAGYALKAKFSESVLAPLVSGFKG